ncbi:hypothetical protein ACFLSI_00165 [Bacteroidota bacterium]
MAFTPLFGFLIDRKGKSATAPAAMWPTMVKLVPEKQIGTAYE